MAAQGSKLTIWKLEEELQVLKVRLREKDKAISSAQSERSVLSREFKRIAKEIKQLTI